VVPASIPQSCRHPVSENGRFRALGLVLERRLLPDLANEVAGLLVRSFAAVTPAGTPDSHGTGASRLASALRSPTLFTRSPLMSSTSIMSAQPSPSLSAALAQVE